MRAFVCTRYGPPETLRLKELDDPSPKDDEVLIQSCAASVTAGDCRVRALKMPPGMGLIARLALGFSGPRQPILGSEMAGRVAAVGKNVTQFKVGDEVFTFTGVRLGCHSELKCVPESQVVPKPSKMTFEEAATMSSGGSTALAFLNKAKIQKGQRIAVVGASGSVGSAAVQLARHFGAEVTGICSAANADLVSSLGAHHVVDYTKQDFTESREHYDVILDTVGGPNFSRKIALLKKGGILLLVNGGLGDMFRIPAASLKGRKVAAGPAAWSGEDLHLLAKLAESGAYRSVVDRQFFFDQIPEAHRYVDLGRKKGNVAITLARS